MKAIVTGGAGFIGSHLVNRLLKDGWEVIVWDTAYCDHLPLDEIIFWHFSISTFTPYSILDFKCDVIFHLAAQSRIQPSIKDPKETFETNVIGTVNVLELAKELKAKVIFTSTCCCKYNEYSSPYALSKYQAEMICDYYKDEVETRICRLFNVYGPNEISSGAYSTVVGIFNKLTQENRPLTITGDGTQRRDFIHVDDVVEALVQLSKFEKGCRCSEVEIGTGISYSINEVADMFNPWKEREMLPDRDGEEQETSADMRSYYDHIDYTPKIKLQDYIKSLRGINP